MMSKAIDRFTTIISIMFISWLLLSFIECNICNITNGSISQLNAIRLLLDALLLLE